MPRKLRCCIGNCQNSRQDAILHKFPVGEKRLNMWLQFLSGVCDISNLKAGVSVICEKHFERRFFSSKAHLSGNAYPSLFTDAEITSGQPTVQSGTAPALDHTYSRKRHYDHSYCKLETVEGPNVAFMLGSNLPEIMKQPSVPTPGPNVPTTSGSNLPELMKQPSVPTPGPNVPTTSGSNLPENMNQPASPTRVTTGPVKPTRISKARQRLISKMSSLTPLTKIIYQEFKKAKKETNFHKRARNAMKFCRESSFETFTMHMNPYAKQIMQMQISTCKKKKNARRFTTDEKVLALAIMKQSPKCYRFLRKIFILPSKSTLNAFIMNFRVETGINPQVFRLLKKEVDSWDSKKKLCSLIFDEMSLDTALTYDKNKDCIHGFVDLQEKKPEYADHALVFMLRGAVYKWQQPLCFYFCKGATHTTDIKKILRQLVESIVDLGLKPIALVSDQGTSFQAELNSFLEETKRVQILEDQHPGL